MSLQDWSDTIVVAELQDEPAFSDDLNILTERVEANPNLDVVLNFTAINYLNSSNLAAMLRLRKAVIVNNGRKLMVCSVNTHVWGLLLTTGLNKTFDFADDVSLALAGLQLERSAE